MGPTWDSGLENEGWERQQIPNGIADLLFRRFFLASVEEKGPLLRLYIKYVTVFRKLLHLSHHPTVVSPEEFRSLRLSFSPNLDDYNPDIPEWRRDISRVIKKSLVEVSADGFFSCPGHILCLSSKSCMVRDPCPELPGKSWSPWAVRLTTRCLHSSSLHGQTQHRCSGWGDETGNKHTVLAPCETFLLLREETHENL